MQRKSHISVEETYQVDPLGRSYYAFCLESALAAVEQARMLVKDDVVETNHGLPELEQMLKEALDAS